MGEVALDRVRQVLVAALSLSVCNQRGLRQFAVHDGCGARFLRIESGQAAREILKFAHIARPAMAAQPVERSLIDLLCRQTLALDLREEVADPNGKSPRECPE